VSRAVALQAGEPPLVGRHCQLRGGCVVCGFPEIRMLQTPMRVGVLKEGVGLHRKAQARPQHLASNGAGWPSRGDDKESSYAYGLPLLWVNHVCAHTGCDLHRWLISAACAMHQNQTRLVAPADGLHAAVGGGGVRH
jgi:hypothetical protein